MIVTYIDHPVTQRFTHKSRNDRKRRERKKERKSEKDKIRLFEARKSKQKQDICNVMRIVQ